MNGICLSVPSTFTGLVVSETLCCSSVVWNIGLFEDHEHKLNPALLSTDLHSVDGSFLTFAPSHQLVHIQVVE